MIKLSSKVRKIDSIREKKNLKGMHKSMHSLNSNIRAKTKWCNSIWWRLMNMAQENNNERVLLARQFLQALQWRQIASLLTSNFHKSSHQHHRVDMLLKQVKLIKVLAPQAWPRTPTYHHLTTIVKKVNPPRKTRSPNIPFMIHHLSLNCIQSSWKARSVPSKPKSKATLSISTASPQSQKLQQKN